MKQLLFILLSLITALNTLHAEDASPYDGSSWNIIRERLFSGENTNAYRFEDDIRFQVIGAKTHQDSAIFIQMLGELNKLLETVQIEMVNANPNFKLTITKESGGQSANYRQLTAGSKIVSANLELGFPGAFTDQESVSQIYYHTLRELTKLYTPQHGSSGYGGIFDSAKAADAEFKGTDKDLLKQLYSPDFYKNLKASTVKKHGYSYYFDLRYQKLMKNLSYSLKAILIIFGFLFFLSKESKRKQNPGLLLYLKQRTIILLILPFFFSLIKTSGDFLPLLVISPLAFIANFLGTVIYALLVLVFLY